MEEYRMIKLKFVSLLMACTVIGIAFIVGGKSNKKVMYDRALENIEAMALDESGVYTSRCGKRLTPSYDDAYHYECNPSTQTNYMLKCGSLKKGNINSFEGPFNCIL